MSYKIRKYTVTLQGLDGSILIVKNVVGLGISGERFIELLIEDGDNAKSKIYSNYKVIGLKEDNQK